MNKIYNEEIKEQFLSQYDNEQTQKTIRNVFYKTYIIENTLEKDIYEQNLSEIAKCIENTRPATKSVAMSNGRFLASYISFAISHGYTNSNINPLKTVLPEFYDNLIDKNRKIHYSYDEFLQLLEELQNGQDQAFLFLIWEGLMGEKFSELRSLKFENIDFENKTVYVEERDQYINVSDKCIEYLEKAYNQRTYYSYVPKTQDYREKALLPSPYVFKNVKAPRTQENTMVNMAVFYNRLAAMKEILGIDMLTPNGISQSGMLWEAVKLYEEEKELGYDQMAKIGVKYNYSTITSSDNQYTYYNTYLMKNFLSQENFMELYGLNIEITKR
ncbi:site-specific integrase [Neobacillus vireti]|uniref:site-specific integrase n=1 Tax=Neobacillus vireti TaxID=220686 RepID=UPI002FFF5FA5